MDMDRDKGGYHADMVDDEYLHGHSYVLERASRMQLKKMEHRLLLNEYEAFVNRADPTIS